MLKVKENIENKQFISPLKKRETWKVIKESKFPILLGILVTTEGIIEGCSGFVNLSATSFFRTTIYIKMTQEAIMKGIDVVKREKIKE